MVPATFFVISSIRPIRNAGGGRFWRSTRPSTLFQGQHFSIDIDVHDPFEVERRPEPAASR